MRRAVLGTAASQTLIVVLLFATSVAVARLLGPEGRGDLARFVNAAALLVLLADLGVATAITFFLASRATSVLRLWRSVSRLYVLTTVIASAVAAAIVASSLRDLLPASLTDLSLVLTLGLFLACSQAANWLTSVLVADTRFAFVNITNTLVALLATFASVSLLLLRPSWAAVPAVIGILVSVEAVRATITAVVVTRLHRSRAARLSIGGPKASGFPLARLIGYSSLAYGAEILQFLVYRLDMWIVDAYHGAAELGTYALAVTLAQLVWLVPVAIARVLFPYSAMPTTRGTAEIAARAARAALAISAICGVLGWLLSGYWLTPLFGEGFAAAPGLIGILLLGIVPFSVAKVLGNYLAGVNAVGLNTVASAIGLAIAIPMNLALVPTMGATGAAWATVMSYCGVTAAIVLFFMRRTGMPVRSLLGLRRATGP